MKHLPIKALFLSGASLLLIASMVYGIIQKAQVPEPKLLDRNIAPRYRMYPNTTTSNPADTPCLPHQLGTSTEPPTTMRVVSIEDGDTVHIGPTDGELEHTATITLWGIDAPEADQISGPNATAALQEILTPGSTVDVRIISHSRYQNIKGTITADGQSVELLLLGNGWAYHDTKQPGAQSNRCLAQFQRIAQTNKAGVWAHNPAGQVRPWIHRDH